MSKQSNSSIWRKVKDRVGSFVVLFPVAFLAVLTGILATVKRWIFKR